MDGRLTANILQVRLTVNGYRLGDRTIKTAGIVEREEFNTAPEIDDYYIYGNSFREATLRYHWKVAIDNGPERVAYPPQTNIKVFHGFRADDIVISPQLPPGDTVVMGDEVDLVANPYPYLDQQERVKYRWFWDPTGQLEGVGHFQYNYPSIYKLNKFIPDYPGDVQLRYKITDNVSGIFAESREPHRVIHIKPKITITTPTPGSKFVFSTTTPGVLTINAIATVLPQALANDIEWTIWNIDGSNLTTNPPPPHGSSVTFNYTNLPDSNNQFGVKYIKASIPAYDVAESVLVNVYYLKDNYDNPAGLEPNWYFYWSQTKASVGKHVYDPNTSDLGYYRFSDNLFFVGKKASLSSRVVCASTDFDGIDLFAAVCLHENQHQSYYDLWWRPIGGYLPNLHLDMDVDRCLDQKEPYLNPPLDPTLRVTYPAGYGGVYDFDDWEYLGYEKECDWIKGKADSIDWASPGHQY